MKSFIIILCVLIVLILSTFFLLFYGNPPIREEVDDKPQNYLNVNHYVSSLRDELSESGRITVGFLPSQIEEAQTIEYLYWYSCAVFGDPNYAISVTLFFPTDETLFGEIDRIKGLEGFEETANDDYIIIGGKELFRKTEAFFEPPVLDGTMYTMEYAIVSTKNQTITYSELCIWENQIIHDKIDAQLNLVYESARSAD